MKRWIFALLLAIFFCAGQPSIAGSDLAGCKWMPGRLIVNFTPDVGTLYNKGGDGSIIAMGVPSVDELYAEYHVTSMTRIVDDALLSKLKVIPDFFRLMVLECPAGTDIPAMMDEFSRNPHVEYAEPDILHDLYDRIPNDPLWNSQWDKRMMRLPRVWDFSTGSRDIIVVAVDGGTWWPHDDLYANLWVNPGEDLDQDGVAWVYNDYPGDPDDVNGVDDDGNGKVDDLIGWDFIQSAGGCAPGEDCSGQDNNPMSIDDHGTHTLGIMGAVGNNGVGLTGVNWNVRILASRAGYKPANDQGVVQQTAALACMTWAIGHGAQVINMSYGSSFFSQSENSTIQTCWNNGVVLCGAAGNETSSVTHYPAGYNNVISIGSVREGNIVSDFSNYGTWVDCYAPGDEVWSTIINGYAQYPGTSMSSPNVGGVAALLWAIFPTFSNQEIVDLILETCVDITTQNPTMNPDHLGHGRVDAQNAVACLLPYLTLESGSVNGDTDGDGRLEPGESGNLVVSLHNDPDWSPAYGINVTIVTNDPAISLSNNTFTMSTIMPGQSMQNSTAPVQISAASWIERAYYAEFTAQLRGDYGFALNVPFTLRIGRPQTLVVGDDGAYSYHSFFTSGIWDQYGGFDSDAWLVPSAGEPAMTDIQDYDVVMWICGDESSNTLSAANQTLLAQYLDNGGNLLLAGQNIDEDISASAFYANYLHCQSDGAASTARFIDGVSGDPIANGHALLLGGGACGGNGQTGPSKITPVNGGVAFFNYREGGTCAVHYDNGIYKTAYFSFAIEAACGGGTTVHHSVILRRAMDWFGATALDADPRLTAMTPNGFALKPNYPNPFNPSTTLTFQVPHASRVTIRVFDMLGRQVTTLLNAPVSAGEHAVTFDGANLPSGVYLAQMHADGFDATQRMVLLK
ncbi:T9SS C-terminal target domain-containing protein [candidate division KSB1 bacterium]|nr:MAG: T9SS C-terminal target domain-containing protein [candidate division KSB1 bacterium]